MRGRGERAESWRAVVTARRPLRYRDGPDPTLDRPAHVRAASGIARVGDAYAIVQDDAAFVAVIEPSGDVRAITLDAGPGGRRQFDAGRGNKHHKRDWEACLVADGPRGPRLIGFGSGSTAARRRLLVIDDPLGDAAARDIDAAALYLRLDDVRFAGSELNLEGAARVGDRLLLFQRGNGAPRGALRPADATAALPWDAFVAWIDDPARGLPPLADIVDWSLGDLHGVRLTFTDAAVGPGGVWFLAAAEASPNVVDDGEVVGVAIGRLDGDVARWTPLVDPTGLPLADKAEGLVFLADGTARVVVDPDDPERPSELLSVEIRGA